MIHPFALSINLRFYGNPVNFNLAKGESKKLALMSICNKLLKQAFAVAKSGLIYDENYRGTLIEN